MDIAVIKDEIHDVSVMKIKINNLNLVVFI